MSAAAAASLPEILSQLGVSPQSGLTTIEAASRRATWGPNAVTSHRSRALPVLWRQLRSPLLALLLSAAAGSYFVGEKSDALIIGVIVGLSVGLAFGNEYRAERAAEALRDRVCHRTAAVRDGVPTTIDVIDLVPGDIVHLVLGNVVPADIRLLDVSGLTCDESVLTGESLPIAKSVDAVPPGAPLGELASCALMGTVVAGGSGHGVVVSTGAHSEFGLIASGLSTRQLDTEFQVGLRRFSLLLV